MHMVMHVRTHVFTHTDTHTNIHLRRHKVPTHTHTHTHTYTHTEWDRCTLEETQTPTNKNADIKHIKTNKQTNIQTNRYINTTVLHLVPNNRVLARVIDRSNQHVLLCVSRNRVTHKDLWQRVEHICHELIINVQQNLLHQMLNNTNTSLIRTSCETLILFTVVTCFHLRGGTKNGAW